MTTLFSPLALLPEGIVRDVRIAIAGDGQIEAVEKGASVKPGDEVLSSRLLLPAPGNLHSHAFQRAMAGMTEYRSAAHDDFWSWRTLMYRFLDILTPEEIEAIAALVYVEMLEAGYASVGEFHYVHHQTGGRDYENIGELSERIFAAVEKTGIGLTHLPVLYAYGGAGEAPLAGGQLRFGCDRERFSRLYEAAKGALRALPSDCSIGVAPHSLRAVSPELLSFVANEFTHGPIHMHVAEQEKEVRDVEAWLGQRPVAWMLDNCAVDDRWCFIHATQMTGKETLGLAASGAVAGLCPITEGNLGDGVFNGETFLGAGGRFGVGSDSNIRISLSEELRQLEYSQRLKHRMRNVMVAGGQSTGTTLFKAVTAGGAQALQRNAGALESGRLADFVAIHTDYAALAELREDQLIDGWLFAGNDDVVSDVWSAGRHMVREGRHIAREAVENAFRSAARSLRERL
ncbi:formimidoylglutamate deiminase [Hoeflea sp. CAU 1731]